jgi:uncharacterized protein (UPF0264 family)
MMQAIPRFGTRTSGLLVSVRSVEEANEAVLGGASIIDIKEPARGPLGRADLATWRAILENVPPSIPVSVALGELTDWIDDEQSCPGICFQKLGLAGAGVDWQTRWDKIRRSGPAGASWVAVAYADWEQARSPEPSLVLDAAIEATDCSGILVDTWDKTKPSPIEPSDRWRKWIERARQNGRFVALAGGLDASAIVRLAPLGPDLFAVRGAACESGDRNGAVKAELVARLVQVIRESRPI